MVFKRREGVRGCRVKNVQKVLAGAISIDGRKEWTCRFCGRMGGRDGVAGAATTTSQRVCAGSTGRRALQGLENGLRVPRRRAKVQTFERQKIRSFGPGLRLWRRKEGREPKEGKAFHPGEGMDMDVEHEIESSKKLDEQKKVTEGVARN